MKKIISLVSITSIIALVACGPSAEEKAKVEKAKKDSIANFETEAKAKVIADSTAKYEDDMKSKMVADSTKKYEAKHSKKVKHTGKHTTQHKKK
jgi:hypothetical protein